MKQKRIPKVKKVSGRIWLLVSFLLALAVLQLLSALPSTSIVFSSPAQVVQSFASKAESGVIWLNTGMSLFRVLCGFLLGFLISIPVAFLMSWYKVFRNLVEPWIQFIRNIPPLAYIPLVIAGVGVGESAKVVVIFIATFLVNVITVYQGIRDVDVTLIKAARVLGANDKDIFLKVIIPASVPFLLVGMRLGLSTALTTLIAAEMTGASSGLGMMITAAGEYYDMPTVLMGILVIGVIGLMFEQIVKFLERKLTSWQETQ
ncbi:ABC transporter permease [Caproicibacter sp.]|uniref:ABC transporter permease n=1 Tax=Caproicibacter sp. TaxID=2814884 RepID=UPI00398A4A3A